MSADIKNWVCGDEEASACENLVHNLQSDQSIGVASE